MGKTTRRRLLQLTASTAAALSLPSAALAFEAPPLTLPAFQPLPLGEILPTGWLLRQLRIQADGMGGHLDEFWPDVGPNSAWHGGTGEDWERGPYFLDGLIPLAVLLDDPRLKAKAARFVEWNLEHQAPDGSVGPRSNQEWWPRMVLVKALAQWAEATGDPRVVPFLTRYFHYQLAAMPGRPLKEWAKYRWQDEVLIIEWLYDRTRDPDLLRLAALLKQQGYDWTASFADFQLTGKTAHGITKMETHGVNHGQALKVSAVEYRLTGDVKERANFTRQLGALDRYHGLPAGIFSCDEHLAGLDPSQGSELCTVVETMFSLEVALATFGDAATADRIEKLAFNALPGTFTDDMWAHQYDQQPNQISVALNSKPWTTNGPESNLYGLEPNFGCCTANFHQGWPKFTASLWMRSPDDGLVATLYSPCEVKTKVRNTPVHLVTETDYPFRETVLIKVDPASPMMFPISLRIPEWAIGATLKVNGHPSPVAIEPNAYARIHRTWQPGDLIELKLPMQPRVTRWFNQSVALNRGPLVFSLDLAGTWLKLRDRTPTADWQVYPTHPFNYALAVDETTAPSVRVEETPIPARPFAAKDAPVKLHLIGRRLPTWLSEDGVALPLPPSPVTSDQSDEPLTLIPYAAAKLRITAFPQLKA